MRTPIFVFSLLLSPVLLCGQTATDINLGAKLSLAGPTVPPTYAFTWWGKSDRHYIVETTPDLVTWTFLPDFNPSGTDAVLGIEFTTDASRYFFRAIQFDPSDTSGLADTDTDGLPDKWELYYFGNLGRDGSADFDGDGLIDRFEFQGGGNPLTAPDATTTGRINFTYDSVGRLDTVTALLSLNFNFDDEGSILSIQ